MELHEAIRRRRMTRSFAPDPVPPEVLQAVLVVANRAPSAGHTQGVDLLVLQEPAARQRFWEWTTDEHFRQSSPVAGGLLPAPVVVLPLASPAAYRDRYGRPDKAESDGPDGWATPYWLVDASFATMLVLLAATEQGLGGAFLQVAHRPAAVPGRAWRARGPGRHRRSRPRMAFAG